MKFFICSPHENYIARVRAKGMKRWWGELGSGSGSVKKALKRIWHENLGTRRMNGMKKLLLLNDRFKIASSRHCCRWYSGKHNTPFHINVVLCICEIFHRAQCEAAAAVFIKYKNLEREKWRGCDMAHGVQQKAETTQLVYFSSCLKLIHFSRLILSPFFFLCIQHSWFYVTAQPRCLVIVRFHVFFYFPYEKMNQLKFKLSKHFKTLSF